MSLLRIWAIIYKELIHIRRDRATLGIILGLPIGMMLIFGFGISSDVYNMNTVVYNQDGQRESRVLIQQFEQSTYFRVTGYVNSQKELKQWIDGGKAKLGLVFRPDYSKKISRGEVGQVQLILDGSDPSVARTALFSAKVIAQNHSSELLTETLQRKGMQSNLQPPVDLRTRVWYNPDMRSLDFNIPGLIGLILQNITVLLTAFALVRERDKGNLEQLIVTPVRSLELIIGKLVPYIMVASIDVAISLIMGVVVFKVKIAGSILLLLGMAAVFLVGALGIGLFISTIAKNQLQAMQIAMAFILPSVLLSGFMFPREAMPKLIYAISYAIPLTYFLQILRGIILKGIGLEYLWLPLLQLSIFGAFILVLAALRFKKKLD